MLFSMLMLIRKHPFMFFFGLYLLFVVPIRSLFDKPITLPAWLSTLLVFLAVIFFLIIRDRLYSKWLELGLRYALEAKGDGCDSHAVKAAKYFMKSALLFGDAGIVNLGLCYAYGFGVEKDPRKAAKCYRVAAEGDQPYSEAQLALGLCYADGIGVERDKIKAEDLFSKALCYEANPDKFWNKNEVLMWLREAGERGNANVQKYLGDYYMAGNDYAEAVKWFRKAAEIEYDYSALHDSSFRGRKKRGEALLKRSIKASAYMQLAEIYLHGGNGVEKDEAEAVQLFRKAAEQGNADAQVALGRRYLDGVGVGRDEAEAIRWFHKAAKQDDGFATQYLKAIEDGDPEAQIDLARDYSFGVGFVENETEASKWYRKAAKQGNADAQAALGARYCDGTGVEKDEVEAVKWYRKAADQGHVPAQFLLGKCYRDGTGVEKNEVEAVQLFRKAAEQGDAEAQILLAGCYLDGVGVEKDEPEAIRWFHRAAKQDDDFAEVAKQYLKAIEDGDPEAQCRLASAYEGGWYFVKNEAEAVKWYRKAAEQGSAGAQTALGHCYRYGKGVEENEVEAVTLFRKAAEQGNADAQAALGNCYRNGIGVAKDENEAVKWLNKAIAQGHAGARESLEKIDATSNQ